MVPAKFCLHRCPAALRQSCCARRDFGSTCSIISSTSQKYMSWLTQEKRWPTQSKRMANARTQMVIFTFHACWRCIGLWPGLSQVPAKVRQCPLVTARGTLAHEKLLGHLSYISSLPVESTLQLPSLCLHHRAGNIIEKMTELTGSLTGHYAFFKTTW